MFNPQFGQIEPRPVEEQSRSSGPDKENHGKKMVSKWSYSETKMLIFAYKENYEQLKASKSSKGKRQVWENIYIFFTEQCENAGFAQSKTIVQSKEKWKSLFDKYKKVKDNNKATGRGTQGFEFFEDMDSFMGCSDKVEPKHIQETHIMTENDGKTELVPTNEMLDQLKESTAEPRGLKRQEQTKDNPEIPKKRKSKSEATRTDEAILQMMEKQQQQLEKSEERDKQLFEGILKSQREAELRHQDFMLAFMGKLGEMFTKK